MLKKLNNYKKIHCCRMCNSNRIRKIFNFGLIPIGNDLQKNYLKSLKCKKYPLKLMNCIHCNHFQLSVSVNPKILYAKNYTYLTGITKTFKDHFDNYSKSIIQKCKFIHTIYQKEIHLYHVILSKKIEYIKLFVMIMDIFKQNQLNYLIKLQLIMKLLMKDILIFH